MGWLRELMQVADQPSFGALARAVLAHEDWPKESRVQPRSLATMLSRFDRSIELEWLSDRPVVQQILAELLNCPVGDLRLPLHNIQENPPVPQRLRIEGVPVARGLDLLEEPLPPGLPNELLIPTNWGRLVWVARPGDGKTLLRQWLNIRGRCEVAEVYDQATAVQLLSSGPPIFIEAKLDSYDEFLKCEPTRPVCLAIDRQVSDTRSLAEHGWQVVASPHISTRVASIVQWLAWRLSPQIEFPVDGTIGWFSDDLVADGTVETFGDVIGWCGLVVDQGLENTRRRTRTQNLARMIKRWLRPQANTRDSRVETMNRRLPELLVAMAEKSMLLRNVDWLTSRTLEEWVDLLPEGERVGPDLNWMKVHLVNSSKGIRAKDVERAAAQFPPGAHRWLALLRDVGLLRPINNEDFSLRPHYISRLCQRVAEGSLIQASSSVWGAALFHALSGASIWNQLRRRADTNAESLVESVLDDLDEESAGSVLALESTVMAVGLSAMSGHEVAGNTAEQLVVESNALALLTETQQPSPRISTGGRVDGVDSASTWWLSLIALSELIPRKRVSRIESLDPWQQSAPPRQLVHLAHSLCSQIARLPSPHPNWILGAFSVFERLRQTIGAITLAGGVPHQIHAPGIVVDEIEHGVLEWSSLRPLIEEELLFEVFCAMADRRGINSALWAESFWRAFSEAGSLELVGVFVRRHVSILGPHVPLELGIAWLDRTETVPCPEVFSYLAPEIIFAWLDRREISAKPLPLIVAMTAAEDVLDKLLVDLDTRDELLLPVLWNRVPQRVVARIQRFRVLIPDKAARWIDTAPVNQCSTLFKAAALDNWLKASAPVLVALRRYCVRCIAERHADWQLAYGWLVRVERLLSQSRPNNLSR